MKHSIQSAHGSVRVLLVALGLALAATGLTGCFAVVAAGAAGTGVAWYRGQLEANLGNNIDAVFTASQKALTQLEFANISNQKSSVDAQLVSRTALDKKVEVRLEKVTDRSTKVIIRVGVFGDETLSMSILDKIKAAL
ncbi:DUF3568 family protein [Opitutus sp. GAS368]|jgi:hypothetical protein|uniref:DUF3568 family protein n=1 Tax=Opitutus sp. GAS368 TaxID=1882749 RepID=UPI00087BC421|nr:DUF3568 family protein [Opitutus sp. GAS368]SDR86081.1 Protein of unknown function [Opitutus sp. GAS368]